MTRGPAAPRLGLIGEKNDRRCDYSLHRSAILKGATMSEVLSLPAFGKAMRKEEFLFADGYLPLNHGSYGTYPRAVHAAKQKWSELAEARPDHFMRNVYMPHLNICRSVVAKAIGADTS